MRCRQPQCGPTRAAPDSIIPPQYSTAVSASRPTFLSGRTEFPQSIRARLHGAESPRYAGYTCWRGICQDSGVLADRSALLAIGSGTQFGVWPCGAGQLYWFLTKNAPEGTRQTKADAVELCRDWAAPAPSIVEGTPEEAIVQNDIVDRPPLQWWGSGAVTLLGDAAHSTTPNLGQGACQALEDAVVLAHCLRSVRPIDAALREYERLRIPRTTNIVRDSWRSGRILQLQRPALESLRNWFMATSLGKTLMMRSFRSLLTYEVPEASTSRIVPFTAHRTASTVARASAAIAGNDSLPRATRRTRRTNRAGFADVCAGDQNRAAGTCPYPR